MSNRCCRMFLLLGMVLGLALTVAAQDHSTQLTTANDPQIQTDESFELNIPERHIVKTNYEASTSVELNDENRDLRLQIGVALRAQTIDVRLRNVTGQVRFRGSLQRILDLLGLHAAVPPR